MSHLQHKTRVGKNPQAQVVASLAVHSTVTESPASKIKIPMLITPLTTRHTI